MILNQMKIPRGRPDWGILKVSWMRFILIITAANTRLNARLLGNCIPERVSIRRRLRRYYGKMHSRRHSLDTDTKAAHLLVTLSHQQRYLRDSDLRCRIVGIKVEVLQTIVHPERYCLNSAWFRSIEPEGCLSRLHHLVHWPILSSGPHDAHLCRRTTTLQQKGYPNYIHVVAFRTQKSQRRTGALSLPTLSGANAVPSHCGLLKYLNFFEGGISTNIIKWAYFSPL